jgi:hypothetical protein
LLGLGFNSALALQLQVDHHINSVTALCTHQENVLVAERLARKGVMPKQLELGDHRDSSAVTMTALLATVPPQFFARLQSLVLVGMLSEDTLQVSGNAPDQG